MLPILFSKTQDIFRPPQSGNLVLWAAADKITGLADNAAVAQWNDLQAGHHLVQATAAQRPLYKTNIQKGYPCVRFDGTDDNMAAAFTVAAPTTMILAANIKTGSLANDIVFDGVTANTAQVYLSTTAILSTWTGISGPYKGLTLDAPMLLASVFNGADPNSKMYMNGGTATTGATNSAAMAGFAIGHVTAPPVADYFELFVYNAVISITSLNILHAYLSAKWNIAFTTLV